MPELRVDLVLELKKKKAKARATDSDASWRKQQERWEREDARRREEQARWEKAQPKLLAAVVKKLKKAPAGATSAAAQLIINECKPQWGRTANKVPRGRTAEDLVRHCAYLLLHALISNPWRAAQQGQKALKPFGIDAKAIVDEVAPKPAKKDGKRSRKGGVKKGTRKR